MRGKASRKSASSAKLMQEIFRNQRGVLKIKKKNETNTKWKEQEQAMQEASRRALEEQAGDYERQLEALKAKLADAERRYTEAEDGVVTLELTNGKQIRASHVVMATGALYQDPNLHGILKPCYSYLVHVPIPTSHPSYCRDSPNFFTRNPSSPFKRSINGCIS